MIKGKILASDYDGTLNRRGISERVRSAISDWQAMGNKFGIVSGRGLQNITALLKNDGIACDFLIGNNGAVIGDREGNVLLYHTAPAEIGKRVAAFILTNGGRHASVNQLSGEYLIVDEERKARHSDDTYYKLLSEYDLSEEFTQISTVCETCDAAMELTDLLNDRFAGKITALVNGICIDIVPYGVDKATGISELASMWKIAYENVCTVGDNYNDVAMLKAFRSYAVANAVDYVKKIASAVVEDIAELCEKEKLL